VCRNFCGQNLLDRRSLNLAEVGDKNMEVAHDCVIFCGLWH
jgi:hypothetical protein